MSTLKRFFERLRSSSLNNYCTCGHMVSVNLPYCPHCGKRLTEYNEDYTN